MAATYHLLCVDCLCYLSLGKVYWYTEEGAPLDGVRAQGVYDAEAGRWAARDETFGQAIEGFLIRHRNHELRFVPEGVDEMLEEQRKAPVESLEVEDVVEPIDAVGINAEQELDLWRRRLNSSR